MTVHTHAKIGGVNFVSGEDINGVGGGHMLRCSSVVTLVRGGRSLYAWVKHFLSFDHTHVAHVRWLPVPDFPTGSPMVVRLMRANPTPREPPVVSLLDIKPSRIAIVHEDACMYMIHLNGIATMPPT